MQLEKILKEQKIEIEEKLKRERIIKREIVEKGKKYLKHPNILAILGIRRCGKSILSWQIFEKRNFGYVNFADERLEELTIKDMEKVLLALYSLYGKNLENIIFDEIHEIKGWEKFVSRLRIRHKIIVTGSNSKMLSGELSTYLTGRHIALTLYPFSFREILNYKEVKYENVLTVREISVIMKNLKEYMHLGGFPERMLFGKEIVRQIYEDVVLKDVVLRGNIKRKEDIKSLARYLISNSSCEFTYRALRGVIRSERSATISHWISLLEEAYLIFILKRYSPKLKEQIIAPKKVYSIDAGFFNVVGFKLTENLGRIMENLVAIELLRRKSYWNSNLEIYYFKDHQQREVDFIVKEGLRVKQLIQVSYASARDEIEKREIKSLLKAIEIFSKDKPEAIVITWDYEAEEEIKGRKIMFVPLWKWLLATSF